jgi:hypothetical protein
MARVAKQDTGKLTAVEQARAKHRVAVEEARKKVADFIHKETEVYYDELIESIRLALIEGHSARQIGQAYGSSDPSTIKKLIQDAGVHEDDVSPKSALRIQRYGEQVVVRAVAFGADKQTGEATFVIDEDGQNITAVDGDIWLQSVLYREGVVKEVLSA